MSEPKVYAWVRSTRDVLAAADAGADGVTVMCLLDDSGFVLANGTSDWAPTIQLARDRGLSVEVCVGDAVFSRRGADEAARMLVRDLAVFSSERVVLSSFDHAAVAAAGAFRPDVTVGFRYGAALNDSVASAADAGAAVLIPVYFAATPQLVEDAHAVGLRVHAWTVADDEWPLDEREQLSMLHGSAIDAVTVADLSLVAELAGASA